MAGEGPEEITKITLVETARLAGLPLGPGRIEALLPQLRTLRRELSKLDELDIRETEPASILVAAEDE